MRGLLRLEQRVRRDLGGRFRSAPRWRDHEWMAERACTVVQMYYIVTAMLLYGSARSVRNVADSATEMVLLWPVIWLEHVPFDAGLTAIANSYVLAGFLGVFLWRFFIVRLGVCLVVLQWAAIPNSFGAMNHGHHEWFWLSFCFVFLPNASRAAVIGDRGKRTRFLYVFSVATALILFFYSLSGFYKFKDAAVMLVTGQYGGFMPDAMAQTLARRALETMSDPLWATIIIENPILGWPLYLGLYYIELVAIFILFRPQLIMPWGVMLIGFHFGTLTFMDITFGLHIIVNGLLFVLTPFAAREFRLLEALRQLPILGILFRSRRRVGNAEPSVSQAGNTQQSDGRVSSRL